MHQSMCSCYTVVLVMEVELSIGSLPVIRGGAAAWTVLCKTLNGRVLLLSGPNKNDCISKNISAVSNS